MNKTEKSTRVDATSLKRLSRLLKLFLDRTLVGPGKLAQTPWVRWVYNQLKGGTYNSPYLGTLKIPSYPLTMKFQNPWIGPYLTRRVNRANKFLQYQFHRLERARESKNSKLYWAIVLGLIRRSTALHVCFLNRVVKGWYFRKSLEWAVKTKSKVTNKAGGFPLTEFPLSNASEIERIYVKKPNGKLRPIGSPSYPDRIHHSMLSYFCTHWTEPWRSPDQHGFRPGRGIWSVWYKLLTEFLYHDNIVEYDLRSFFNRVPLYKGIIRGLELKYSLEDALKHFEFPEHIIHRLLRLMQSTPMKLPDEFDPADAEAWWLNPSAVIAGRGESYRDEGFWLRTETEEGEEVWTQVFSPFSHGMTQGSPLSPTLAGIFLDYIDLTGKVGAEFGIHYADDGLFAWDNPIHNWLKGIMESMKEIGRVNLEHYGGRFRNLQLNNRKNRVYQTCVGMYHLVRAEIFNNPPLIVGPFLADSLMDRPRSELPKSVMPDLNLPKRRWTMWKSHCREVQGFIKDGTIVKTMKAIEFNLEKTKLLKKNGKWLVKEFKFLGSTYNTQEDTLNGIKVSSIDLKNLWKIVGRTYNVEYPESWSWGINPNSILWRLIALGSISGKLAFVEPLKKLAEDKRCLVDPDLLLTGEERKMITQSSTISCGLLLHIHDQKHGKKPLSLICEEPTLLTPGKH